MNERERKWVLFDLDVIRISWNEGGGGGGGGGERKKDVATLIGRYFFKRETGAWWSGEAHTPLTLHPVYSHDFLLLFFTHESEISLSLSLCV